MLHSLLTHRPANDSAGHPHHPNDSGHHPEPLADSADSPVVRLTVLVVEDDPGVAAVERMLLEQAGFTVLLANNGTTGWEMAQRHLPAAVVLDVDLPGLNGCEVCRRLKESPATRHLPVLICSGNPNAREQARQAGADDFLAKAEDVILLAPRVLRLLGRSAQNPA